MGEIKKTCNCCKHDKALSNYRPNPLNDDGFNKACNACIEYRRKYQSNNKEKTLERRKEYLARNKEKIAERKKKYQAKNKEKFAEFRKKHYINNRENIIARKKEYFSRNPEKRYETGKKARSNFKMKTYQAGIDFALSQLAGIVDQKILDSIQSSEVPNVQ